MTKWEHAPSVRAGPGIDEDDRAPAGSRAPLSQPERQARLLDQINRIGRILASDAAATFGVSEDSIRRDLRDLADAGLVQRFHGGAIRRIALAADFATRVDAAIERKRAIGEAAVALIPNDATLLIDSSTTALQFVKALPAGFRGRIITAGPDIAAAALDHPLIEVIMIGGRLNRKTRSSTGASALDGVQALKADICILGPCGIDEGLSLRADDFDEAIVKGAMVKASMKTIALLISERIGNNSPFNIAQMATVSAIVTENSAEGSILARVREIGVNVILANGARNIMATPEIETLS